MALHWIRLTCREKLDGGFAHGGRGRPWKCPASKSHMKRFKAKDIEIKTSIGQHKFHCADGSLRQESVSERPPPAEGFNVEKDSCRMIDTENEDSENESVNADPDAQAAEHEVWSTSGRYIFGNHDFPRTSLYPPKDDFPIPVRYVVVCRQTRTSLDDL